MPTHRSFLTGVLLPVILLVLALTLTIDSPAPKPPVPPPPAPVCVKPELLIFTASWCGACQSIKEQINQIEASGVKVTRIDYDENPELVNKYNVTSVPTMLVTQCGRIKRTQDIADVLRWLREVQCATSQ